MQKYKFIAMGRSVNSTKFDDLGEVAIDSQEKVEHVANLLARGRSVENKRRKVISVFRSDEDMACYTVVWDGFANFTRSYEKAAQSKRSLYIEECK